MKPALRLLLLLIAFFYVTQGLHAATVTYDLDVTEGRLNPSGKKPVDFAILVNGSLPAPTLRFTEGDEAVITLHNKIRGQEISVHWHGLLLPPEMDGVPYVNTPPIASGSSFTFRFPLRTSGTYWYHTHTHVQEQKGLYGAIVVQPKKPSIAVDREAVVVMSDWSDEDAHDILAHLKKDGDYYLYKKKTLRSWYGASQVGALATFLQNEWTRMGGMDLSDVGYDAFLINGQRSSQLLQAKAGERIRIRLINAAASSYFHVALGQSPMQIISADGIDVRPAWTRSLLMGMAETYDVLFTVPEDKSYELRVSAQDGSGFAAAWIGQGEKVAAPAMPQPDLYAAMDHSQMSMEDGSSAHSQHQAPAAPMDHSQHQAPAAPMDHSLHASMHHGPQAVRASTEATPLDLLTVDQLEAKMETAFPSGSVVHDVKLVLDGDMSRYVWYINGKAMFEERTIFIKEGDIVRFTLVNATMMHHPMHLHGHFFRVVNSYGSRSPWKHTVDVPPHGTRSIEFRAQEPGEWMLHCHNLYHMKTGMARVVKYSDYQVSPAMQAIQAHDPHLHDHPFTYGLIDAASNRAQFQFKLMQTWNELDLRLEGRRETSWKPEGDLLFRRWNDRFLNLFAGASSFDQKTRAVLGVGYLLPLLVKSQLLVDHEGKLRLDLSKHFQWTSSVFSEISMKARRDFKTEWEMSLMYKDSWSWALGFNVAQDSAGFGASYQF